MSNVRHDTWKGHAISIQPIAVRGIVAPSSPVDGYLATVHIDKDGQTLADWHLPRDAQQRATADEAQRDGFRYAVKLIDRGVLNLTPSVWILQPKTAVFTTGHFALNADQQEGSIR
jgi:hypothetical protein